MTALKPQKVADDRKSSPLYTGLPVPNGSISFWLGQTRNSPLLGIQSHLPVDPVDLVIIGSGYSGVATAYWLMTGPNPPKSIVMLEAREICSGATGRNGGFCRPDVYRGYAGYKRIFGREQAMKILEQEMATFLLTEEVITKEGIDCDWHKSSTMDIAMDPRCKEEIRALMEEYIRDDGKNAALIDYCDEPDQVSKRTRAKNALAFTEVPCASLWPYKLVCGLLSVCLQKGLSLQSSTPATAITQTHDGLLRIETPRGAIKCTKVLHATNAFTPTLLPELEGYMAPVRGQAARIIPPLSYSGGNMLESAPMFRHSEKTTDYDYMNQRKADGNIICGGGRITISIEDMVGQTDDRDFEVQTEAYLRTLGQKYMQDWPDDLEVAHGQGVVQSWSGIMSYTHSMIPFVGPVPGRPNQFICAGHSGHGMARIMGIGRGLAQLLRGGTWADTGLPECFQMSSTRLNEAQSVQEEFWSGKKGWVIQPVKL